MYSYRYLLIAGLVTFSCAADDAKCDHASSEAIFECSEYPPVDDALGSFINAQVTNTIFTDCIIPSVTGSLASGTQGSQYTSYMSELSTWYDDCYSLVLKAWDICSTYHDATQTYDFGRCTILKWEDAIGSGDAVHATSSDNDAHAAPQKTGMAMAAAAMAGFVVAGVV
ncbi:hypothetical protein BGZ63DRAFT_388457 [Mariannaea sp. PMI_226]|nr:hypothetical protein BGZ63DRAFT_388457 [Mariannaea sp. PMI_226]